MSGVISVMNTSLNLFFYGGTNHNHITSLLYQFRPEKNELLKLNYFQEKLHSLNRNLLQFRLSKPTLNSAM